MMSDHARAVAKFLREVHLPRLRSLFADVDNPLVALVTKTAS